MEQGQSEINKDKVNIKKEILSWVFVIIGGFLLALFITKVVIIKAVVPTGSMENTILVGDKMVGNRLAYLFSEPKRGDIIIFQYPGNIKEDYVKRVIGIPGDTVTLKEGHVFVNDVMLEEEYIKEPMRVDPEASYVVPEDSYFVLGDNRNISKDSRSWVTTNYVHKDLIRGKVWFRYSPSWGVIK